ncbi:MAG TPA: hypothetical protein VGB45_08015 [Abditibacterium sp.]|jgi:hypothetical protein
MEFLEANLPDLPEGYYYPAEKEAAHLHAELQRELPEGHLLFGVPVETFAAYEDNQDVLVCHTNQPERFTLIHLTWVGKTEISAYYPSVTFDGNFAGFLEQEQRFDAFDN